MTKPQPAVCGECLHSFDEPEKRIPCPRCGSTSRAHIRHATEQMTVKDKPR